MMPLLAPCAYKEREREEEVGEVCVLNSPETTTHLSVFTTDLYFNNRSDQ